MTARTQARALARERDLFDGISGLPTTGLVVIGGYAVSARSIPRYSHDIDIVLDAEAAERLRSFLRGRGFEKTRSREGFEQNYGGSWERWQRAGGGATVDLLPSSVQDRHFQVPMPFARVARGATPLTLRGLEASELRLPVASTEVLIALKLQPLRERDLGDIACLATAGYEPRLLRGLLLPLHRAKPALFEERLAKMRARFIAAPEEAIQFLGARIPGPRPGRERAVRAIAALLAEAERAVGG
jgi:hypothetical protein